MRDAAVTAPRIETVSAEVLRVNGSGVEVRGETNSQLRILPPEMAAKVKRKRGALDTILSSLKEFKG